MSSANRTDELVHEIDQQDIGVAVTETTDSVPTIECDSETHNGEPVREGELGVLLLARTGDGEWVTKNKFCGHCDVGDAYSNLDAEGQATAVVEGIVVPENEFGPSKQVHLLDAFLWEVFEDTP